MPDQCVQELVLAYLLYMETSEGKQGATQCQGEYHIGVPYQRKDCRAQEEYHISLQMIKRA